MLVIIRFGIRMANGLSRNVAGMDAQDRAALAEVGASGRGRGCRAELSNHQAECMNILWLIEQLSVVVGSLVIYPSYTY